MNWKICSFFAKICFSVRQLLDLATFAYVFIYVFTFSLWLCRQSSLPMDFWAATVCRDNVQRYISGFGTSLWVQIWLLGIFGWYLQQRWSYGCVSLAFVTFRCFRKLASLTLNIRVVHVLSLFVLSYITQFLRSAYLFSVVKCHTWCCLAFLPQSVSKSYWAALGKRREIGDRLLSNEAKTEKSGTWGWIGLKEILT